MKIMRAIGIIAISLFSFFYTEKIANLTLEKNNVYKSISNRAEEYKIDAVDALIDGDYITPGLNGKVVNVKTSYFNMKALNAFNESYLLFDTSYPNVSINDNKDKIIKNGNPKKREVAFILEYDNNIIKYFLNKKIDASVLVNVDNFDKKLSLEQINNEVNKYKSLETLINKYSDNSNICYLNNKNIDICKKNKKYLVKSDKVLNNTSIKKLNNNILNGDIIYIEKNTDTKNINLIINSILYKDLDIVRLSKLLSEER